MIRTTYPVNLACPLDATALAKKDQQLCCAQGHHFDVARQGYVNLLTVQQKKSKQPGDNKEMVAARAAFLNTHAYQPIAGALQKTINELWRDDARHYCVLDAGCGDGYYLTELINSTKHQSVTWIGVDISKFAVIAAAKRHSSVAWMVASNKQLPVLPHSVDIILSVFGFPSEPGFVQALTAQGYVVLVEPGAQHLIELRHQLYETVDSSPIKEKPWLSSAIFCEKHKQRLTYQVDLLSNNDIVNLLKMTPHFYRAPKEAIAHVCQQANLSVTIDVVITVYQKVDVQ